MSTHIVADPSVDPLTPPTSAPVVTIAISGSTAVDPSVLDGPPPPASTPLSVVSFSIAFYGPVENLTHTVDVHTTWRRDSREVPPTTLEVAAVSSMVLPVSLEKFAYIFFASKKEAHSSQNRRRTLTPFYYLRFVSVSGTPIGCGRTVVKFSPWQGEADHGVAGGGSAAEET